MKPRPIFEIAAEVQKNWKHVHYAALPYLNAMGQLVTMHDQFWNESAKQVVGYFLANAGRWHGETAARVKAELRGML